MRNGAYKAGEMEEQVTENDIYSSPPSPSKSLSVHKVLLFSQWLVLVLTLRFTGGTGLMVCLGDQKDLLTRCFLTKVLKEPSIHRNPGYRQKILWMDIWLKEKRKGKCAGVSSGGVC